jgi:hypothetical protein
MNNLFAVKNLKLTIYLISSVALALRKLPQTSTIKTSLSAQRIKYFTFPSKITVTTHINQNDTPAGNVGHWGNYRAF